MCVAFDFPFECNVHFCEVWSPAERVDSERTLTLLLRVLSLFLQLPTRQIQTAVYLQEVISLVTHGQIYIRYKKEKCNRTQVSIYLYTQSLARRTDWYIFSYPDSYFNCQLILHPYYYYYCMLKVFSWQETHFGKSVWGRGKLAQLYIEVLVVCVPFLLGFQVMVPFRSS